MAQIFGKSSNSMARVSLVGGISSFFGLWGLIYLIYWSPYTTDQYVPREQEIPFSHQHHVGGLGLDCRYCHTSVEKSSFAGIPPTETCMTCHSRVWTDAPMLAPERQSLATLQPVHWKRVNDLPDFVFFNHSIHVARGVGCVTCHGRVDHMPAVYKAQPLTMQWCLNCHRDPTPYLRPQDRITDMKWNPPNQTEIGVKIREERKINPPTNCSGCHR